MPEPQGIAFSLSNRRAVLKDDPAYDKLLLALRDEQPEALQDDEIAHLQALSEPNFRTQNDPVADRAQLGVSDEAPYTSTMGRTLLGGTGAKMSAAPPLSKWDEFTGTLGELLHASTGTARGDLVPLVDFTMKPANKKLEAIKQDILSRLPEDTGDRSTFFTPPSVTDPSPMQTRIRNEAGHIVRAATNTARLAAGFIPDTNLDAATFGTAKILGTGLAGAKMLGAAVPFLGTLGDVTKVLEAEPNFYKAAKTVEAVKAQRLKNAGKVADAAGGLADEAGLADNLDNLDDLDEAEELGRGSAGWFPPALKAQLDDVASKIRDQQRKDWIAAGKPADQFGPRISEIKTAIQNVIRNDISRGDPREAQRLIDGYFTTPLPSNYRGVNFDARRPVVQLFQKDTTGGVVFDDTARQRLALAFEQGSKRAAQEQWGDSRWLYHLSNGDPKVAVQITRLLGAFSPGQKTDANTLNAIEAFLRRMSGESVNDILGHKVPDPGRPGKLMRQGATLSTGHPRPGTVQDNLHRAMELGRIFDAKVEALAGAEIGLHDDIPIDLWLMRAIGAASDTTPGAGEYRLISEAMAKEAAAKGEDPFTYMAKVWMGMQDITGRPTLSFAESASHIRLPGHLKTPGMGRQVLDNMEFHGAGLKDQSLPGATSPIATDAPISYDQWAEETQALFREGKMSDILGKKKVVQKPASITLEQLQAQARNKDLSESMMRGASRPGMVMANVPLEAAAGAKGGVTPDYLTRSQADQKKRDKSLLGTLLDRSGLAGVAEALFPGRTAKPIPGEGYWPTPQGVQRNELFTIPIEMRTTPSGRRLDKDDQRRAMTLSKYLGITYGQDAVPTTAVSFDPTTGPRNVVRSWPSAGEKMPPAGQAISAQLPSGDWVIQHRDTGVDIFRPGGETLSQADKQTLTQAAKGVMTPKGQRGAGARAGRNIAGAASYVQPAWGAEGSRQATEDFIKTWDGLALDEKTALDAAVKTHSAQVLRRIKGDPNTSPAHLNFLKIASEGGVTAVKKALKDPNQLLPVLAILVGGSALVPRQNESPDGP